MSLIIPAILTALIAVVVKHFIALIHNYSSAKELGIPIIICPVDNHHVLWLLNQAWLLQLFRRLPKRYSRFAKYLTLGWHYQDRHSGKESTHDELGPAFVLVTPGKNQIVISEPVAIHDIYTKYKVFDKPWIYQIHDLFGKNVDTVNGDEWQRHRKITAPAFNERVSKTVWEEARRQAEGLLDILLSKQREEPYIGTYEDTKKIALHVLMYAGVGIQQDFAGGVAKAAPGHRMSFVHALNDVMEVLPLAWLTHFRPKLFQRPFMPKVLREASLSFEEVRDHLDGMIKYHQDQPTKHGKTEGRKANLLESLVKASEDSTTGQKHQLSIDDIRGNLYIFNFAGHETTANALCVAIASMAAHPQYQEWIVAEVDALYHGTSDYEATFSKMKRCLALMYEVLRLYPSVVFAPRNLASTPATIIFSSGKTLQLQSEDTVFELNQYDMSFHVDTWGDDVYSFRPDRFIVPLGQDVRDGWVSQGTSEILGEQLVFPPSNKFMPWSAGPRVCPGMKFAQVEFVSVIRTLFSKARVDVASSTDRSSATARQELQETVKDMTLKGSTVQMRCPQDVKLNWTSR